MENKTIRCPKCGHDWIGQTEAIAYGFSWFTCYKCHYKSKDRNEFIGVKA